MQVNLPIREVFAFFERPENLARITPPQLGFEILTPSPVEMRAGTQIDYKIRVAGIPLRWTTLITHYNPPHEFVDEQLKGPYSFWRHTHTFREIDAGTLLIDDIEYSLPLGVLGQLVHALKVRQDLEKIFSYRSRVIANQFR